MKEQVRLTIVEGCRYTGDDLDMSTDDAWGIALDQRHFGPRQLVVVTARAGGVPLGIAHCERTEPPELGLTCCLAALDDGADAVVAYSDEPCSLEEPPGLAERFATARAVAAGFGVHLVDWIMCDDIYLRSIKGTLLPDDWAGDWWDVPALDPPTRR